MAAPVAATCGALWSAYKIRITVTVIPRIEDYPKPEIVKSCPVVTFIIIFQFDHI
jgi:hypothetical protein